MSNVQRPFVKDSIPGSCITTEANDGLLVICLQMVRLLLGQSLACHRVAWPLRLAPILPGLVYSTLPGRYCAGGRAS